jgi:hypothetical protein
VTGGVDTDVLVAAALDPLGALLGSESFATTPAGYHDSCRLPVLLAWLESFGGVTKLGVEGTGSCGAGLARFLRRAHIEVIEVAVRTEPNDADRASQILSMPSRLPERPPVAGPPAFRSPKTVVTGAFGGPDQPTLSGCRLSLNV